MEQSVAKTLGIYSEPGSSVKVKSYTLTYQLPSAQFIKHRLSSDAYYSVLYSILVTILNECIVARNTTPSQLALAEHQRILIAVNNGNLTTTLAQTASNLGASGLSSASVQRVNVSVLSILSPTPSPTVVGFSAGTGGSSSPSVALIAGIVLAVLVATGIILCLYYIRACRRKKRRSDLLSSSDDWAHDDIYKFGENGIIKDLVAASKQEGMVSEAEPVEQPDIVSTCFDWRNESARSNLL